MNRLVRFREDAEAVGKYREAIKLLYGAGIDKVLVELALPKDIDINHSNAIQMLALSQQKSLGFVEAINTLFGLLDLGLNPEDKVSRDYGSRDRLLEQGIIEPNELNLLDEED